MRPRGARATSATTSQATSTKPSVTAAAAIQVERYERLEHVVKKSAKDVVTEADHQSEEAIIGFIREAFPGDAILAEESGHSEAGDAGGPTDGAGSVAPVDPDHRIWIIDPLDGTVNYAAGIPHFCTSVGFAVGGRPVVGVVIDPLRGEVFSAVAGQGARLDDRPIGASTRDLGDGIISLALPPSGFSRIDRHLYVVDASGALRLEIGAPRVYEANTPLAAPGHDARAFAEVRFDAASGRLTYRTCAPAAWAPSPPTTSPSSTTCARTSSSSPTRTTATR